VLTAVMRNLAVAGLLSACAAETPWRTPITTAPSGDGQSSTECSLIGRIACSTMAIVTFEGSDSRQASCTASRSGGTYIETCGTAVAAAATVSAPPSTAPPPKPQNATANTASASSSSVQLTWNDNSNNEAGFVIERCDQILRDMSSAKTPTCRGAWKTVASVAANTTTYVDRTVTANQTYIYRVKATNSSGSSAYTPEAVITAPGK